MKRKCGTLIPLGAGNSDVNNPQDHPAVQKQASSNLTANKASTSGEITTNALVKAEPLKKRNENSDNSDEDAFSKLTLDMKLRLVCQLCESILKDLTLGDYHIDHKPEEKFRAKVTVDNHEYEAHGISKQAAMNMARKKVWEDYTIYKIEFMESKSEDLSMLHLASCASDKLVSKRMRVHLPLGWEYLHPSALLNIMCPKASYVYFDDSDDSRGVPKRMGVIVDNRYFEAQGRSKKNTKRLVAGLACNALFGTEYGD